MTHSHPLEHLPKLYKNKDLKHLITEVISLERLAISLVKELPVKLVFWVETEDTVARMLHCLYKNFIGLMEMILPRISKSSSKNVTTTTSTSAPLTHDPLS